GPGWGYDYGVEVLKRPHDKRWTWQNGATGSGYVEEVARPEQLIVMDADAFPTVWQLSETPRIFADGVEYDHSYYHLGGYFEAGSWPAVNTVPLVELPGGGYAMGGPVGRLEFH